ncbi:MAG: glycoside hydrolase family 15 protein [Candidatus Woesearchaeota archaeon]
MITSSIRILTGLQNRSGLLSASNAAATGYNQAWIRDNIYESLGFEALKKTKSLKRIYRTLLNVFLKHEWKIDYAIKEKPRYNHQYIHARYNPITSDEILENWGNKQNDAIGAFLFKIGDLENKGIKIIRNRNDKRIIQKLVYYLKSVEYWHDKDNGMWEENEEVHASSVGACLAGLKQIQKISKIDVPQWMIDNGQEALNNMLPRESRTKPVDLALLSLIYPFNIVSEEQRNQILTNVEEVLVRNRGILRYLGDHYYGEGNGREAEWTMGFPWLAIIYKQLKNPRKYAYYYRKTIESANEKKELPELYFAGTDIHNENSPLGWAQSLYLVMVSC